ncbi:hypothetical protein [Solitalea koreensis]|nr:hypothetical protein [Solitalea koreensis]
METNELIKRSQKVSFASFLIGTGLLILFFFTNEFIALGSLPILLFLGVANLFLLVKLALKGLKEKERRKRVLLTAGIMSLNIPIVFLYAHFVFVLFNTVVVRFKNNTGKPLTNISVIGCDERTIQDLQPGQTEIEWIPITKNCIEHRIEIKYEIDGVVKREVVDGYVVTGRRINHKIGDNRELLVAE